MGVVAVPLMVVIMHGRAEARFAGVHPAAAALSDGLVVHRGNGYRRGGDVSDLVISETNSFSEDTLVGAIRDRPTRFRSVFLVAVSVVARSIVARSVTGSVIARSVTGSVIARSVTGSVVARSVTGSVVARSVIARPIAGSVVAGRGRRGSAPDGAECSTDQRAGCRTTAASGYTPDGSSGTCTEQATADRALARIIRIRASRQGHYQSQGKCAG
jgi:hypothetical protein